MDFFYPNFEQIALNSYLPLVKIMFILGLLFYLFFSYIVIRQVGLMINSLQGLLSRSLLVFAYLHFGLVLALLVLSLFVL